MNYVYNKNLLINLAEVCTVFVENKKCDNLLQPGVPALIVSQSQMDWSCMLIYLPFRLQLNGLFDILGITVICLLGKRRL